MSFLELFDVLNEQLNARGRGARRVRPRLPRGHLRVVRHDDRRPRPRPRDGHRDVPAPPAQAAGRRDRHRRAVAGRRVPDHPGPRGRPQRVRPDRRGRRLHHRPHRRARATPTRSSCPRKRPTRRWTRPRASGAARAWPRARTAPRSSSPSAKYSHLCLLPQGQPERYTRVVGDGGGDGAVVRLLHEPRRVRGGVPEGDLDRLHRAAEPRLREGAVQEHAPRRPARLIPGPPPNTPVRARPPAGTACVPATEVSGRPVAPSGRPGCSSGCR